VRKGLLRISKWGKKEGERYISAGGRLHLRAKKVACAYSTNVEEEKERKKIKVGV